MRNGANHKAAVNLCRPVQLARNGERRSHKALRPSQSTKDRSTAIESAKQTGTQKKASCADGLASATAIGRWSGHRSEQSYCECAQSWQGKKLFESCQRIHMKRCTRDRVRDLGSMSIDKLQQHTRQSKKHHGKEEENKRHTTNKQ